MNRYVVAALVGTIVILSCIGVMIVATIELLEDC